MRRPQLRFLSQAQAQRIDEELMSTYAFSIDQLMELAGLSVACVVENEFRHVAATPLLVVAGPGNNGGDALVAARHLKHFGFLPEVHYPKPTANPLYQRLVQQCHDLRIPFVPSIDTSSDLSRYGLVLDGIFGFSFRGPPRPPFDNILTLLARSSTPVVSIDIPSGWDVERGDPDGHGLRPHVLVSLTAPKQCAQHFEGLHFVGGRFGSRRRFQLGLPNLHWVPAVCPVAIYLLAGFHCIPRHRVSTTYPNDDSSTT